MGCASGKLLTSKVGRKEKAAEPRWLTSSEIAVIRNNWQTLKLHMANVGVKTFVGMFESEPEIQTLFGDFRSKELQEIQQDGLIRQHAIRVMTTIDKCIGNLDDAILFKSNLRDVGVSHKKYGVSTGYMKKILPHFLNAIRPQLEDYWTDDMSDAWKTLFALIIHYMERGMGKPPSNSNEKDSFVIS